MRRVTRHVERLLRQRRPKPFVPTDDEAAAIRAAITLRGAQPEASIPRAEFVAELRHRVAERLRAADETETERPTVHNRRRDLLIGASAAVAAGAAVVVTDRALTGEPAAPAPATTLEPNTGFWYTVMPAGDLPVGGVTAFDTGVVAGFVTRTVDGLAARSGTCTHQGCRLNLDRAAHRLTCPCHRTAFTLDGQVIRSQLPTPPARLPAIKIREHDHQIQVYVPTAD